MRPGISSTASIGDQDFNLTVKRYDIPVSNTPGNNQILTSFAKTDSGLTAGSSRLWQVFSDFNRIQKFYIDKIIVNSFLTNSSGTFKTSNRLVCTLTDGSGSGWTGLGGWVTTANPTDINNSTLTWQSNPDAYLASIDGPFVFDGTGIRLDCQHYATIALNDVIYWTCQIYWRPK